MKVQLFNHYSSGLLEQLNYPLLPEDHRNEGMLTGRLLFSQLFPVLAQPSVNDT